jgi:hypothetical protein
MKLFFESFTLSNKLIVDLIFKVTNFFFIIGVFMSFNLWFSIERDVPFISIIKFHDLGLISVCISAIFLCLMCVNLIVRKRLVIFIMLLCLIFLLLLDRMKWQPWVYFYFLVFCIYLFQKLKCKSSYFYLIKYLLGAMYFWAGVQKLSPGWMGIISRYSGIYDEQVRFIFSIFPYVEILVGLLVLVIPINKIMSFLLISFHGVLILYVFGFQNNSIIIPWNIYFIVIIVLLFHLNQTKDFLNPLKELKVQFIFFLFFCIPILNFTSNLDHYLAFSLYSGKIGNIYLIFDKKDIDIVQKEFNDYFLGKTVRYKNKVIVKYSKYVKSKMNVPAVIENDVGVYLKQYYQTRYSEVNIILF